MLRALLAITALAPAIAHAQPKRPPPSAAQVLANVEATYQQPTHFTAGFTQTVTYALNNKTTRSTGKLYVEKPDKIRFDYEKAGKPDRTFLFDGVTLWIIDHGNMQVLQQPAQNSNLPAAIRFFTGAGSLATEFKVGFPTSPKHLVPGATVLALTPRQPSAQYSELYLVIDPTRWQVTKTIVINSSGDANTFELSNMDVKKSIAASVFQFKPSSVPHYKLVNLAARTPARAPKPSAPTKPQP
jgi:outer membrane lipoprotein-sorting protein